MSTPGWQASRPPSPPVVRPISEIRALIQPGDVVLTGRRTHLSPAIQLATRSPVSHAALMVFGDLAIEADDHKWNLSERGGGTHARRLSEIVTDEHTFVAVRRPPPLNQDVLRRWACFRLCSTEPFASSGLVMMAWLRVRLLWRAALHSGPLRCLPRLRTKPPAAIEWIADGPHRLLCAELVYRGLLTAGVDVELIDPVFAEALAVLPPARAEAIPVHHWRLASSPKRELLLWEAMTQRRRFDPGDREVRVGHTPQEFSHWVVTSTHDLVRQWRTRAAENIPGDQADFVCPGDLLRSPTLTDVIAFRRGRQGWKAVDLDHHR